jgi:hypothetical protein
MVLILKMQHIVQVLKPLKQPHLLVGDLNALTRGDYSTSAWNERIEINKANGWAPPADSSAEG